MKIKSVLATCVALGLAAQSNAATFPFTGTFSTYKLVGVAIPLTGVNTALASWPVYDTDLTNAGFQNTTFTVSGTIDITAGVVTGAVINQTSPLLVDTAGATGYTHADYNNISWTYSGGTTLPLTPGNGPNVTGTCTIVVLAGSSQCGVQLAALQAGTILSTWNWLGITPNFQVSDLFGGSGIFFLDVGGASGHPGVAWTVSGNNVTALVTQSVPNATTTLFTAYQGVFSLVTVGDTDGDGVVDSSDNCRLTANPLQQDANADGYGNICDADINNSGTVTTADFGLLRSVLGQSAGFNATAAASDLNSSGTVTTADFGLLRARLGTTPGPSGLACAGTPPCPIP